MYVPILGNMHILIEKDVSISNRRMMVRKNGIFFVEVTMEVYLDNSATTQVYPEVADLVVKVMREDYGNPSSLHKKGMEAEYYIRNAKKSLAGILRVQEKEILFTSGGTESDNLALIGTARAQIRRGKHIITTKIEHPAVLQTCAYLEKEGFEVTYLNVDRYGLVSLEELKKAVRPDTILVSIMFVNNEMGALEPIAEIGKMLHKMNPSIVFHVDAVQAFGKVRILPKQMGIDLMSASSHKIHGPKGEGFLYIRDGVRIVPINYGGGQQKNMRSGTENVPGIAGMARAAEILYHNFEQDSKRLYELKEYFIQGVKEIPEVVVNTSLDRKISAPHVVSVSFKGVRSEVLLHTLEEFGIYISAGSACASNKPSISATLKAIGVERDLLDSTIRFSFSVFTTKEELDYTLSVLYDKIPMLRKYARH